MSWSLALAQFAPRKGDVSANLDTTATIASQACAAGVELVAFPESALTGYYLEDEAGVAAISADHMVRLLDERLNSLPRRIDLLVGFYETADGQPYNSAAYVEVGAGPARLVHVYRKFFLPTYGMFDEERHHQRGQELGIFDTRLGRFGVLICEDVWHSVLGTLLALSGAQLVLVPSASPVRGLDEERPGNLLRYERMLRSMSEEHGCYSAAAMLTGFEGGKGLSGGSAVFDPFGDKLIQAPIGEDAMVLANIDLETVRQARQRTPLVGDLRASWSRIVELAQGVETSPGS